MEILLDGFVIEGSKLIGKYSKFNLYRLYTVEKGKMAGKTMKKGEWFDTSLENCLRTIVQKRLEQENVQVSLDTYIEKYQEIVIRFEKELNKINRTLERVIESNKKLMNSDN